jgi:hypothetical protein
LRGGALSEADDGSSTTLLSADTQQTWMTTGSPSGIRLASSRSNRCASLLLIMVVIVTNLETDSRAVVRFSDKR